MTYTADITREGKNWLATVTNLDGVSTWVPNFRQLNFYGRDAIALTEDPSNGAEDTLEITWRMTDAPPDVAVG